MTTNAEVQIATRAEVIAAAGKLDDVVVIDASFILLAMDSDNPECPYTKAYGAAYRATEAIASLTVGAKQKHIAALERQYEEFCTMARKVKEELDGVETDSIYDEETRRLETECTHARTELQEFIAYNRLIPSNFPTKAEVAEFEVKKAAKAAVLGAAEEAQQEHRQSLSLRVTDINVGRIKLSELVNKEARLRRELEILRAPQIDSESTLLVMR